MSVSYLCRVKIVLFVLFLAARVSPIYAQEHQTWIAGAGLGGAMGVNEDQSRPIVRMGRIEALAFNSIVKGVSPEFGISFFTLSSKTQGRAFDYQTRIIAPDLRFRFSPLPTITWFPYLFGGGGIVIYKLLELPGDAFVLTKSSDATAFFTFGVGISHQVFEQLGIDFNIGPAISVSDDINPVHDGRYDGWWTGVLSVYWIF